MRIFNLKWIVLKFIAFDQFLFLNVLGKNWVDWTVLLYFVIQNLPKEEDRVNFTCYQYKLSLFAFSSRIPKKAGWKWW